MNERIKELVEQAGMTLKAPRPAYDDEPDGYLESDLEYLDNNLEATRVFFDGGLEKFAELIVRECVGRIQLHNRMDEVTEQWVYDNLVSDVKEHFGVE
jgi:hypothetical protein